MTTVRIHAELIAAFLGDDEPCYGECQCAPCRDSAPNPREGTVPMRTGALPMPAHAYSNAVRTISRKLGAIRPLRVGGDAHA